MILSDRYNFEAPVSLTNFWLLTSLRLLITRFIFLELYCSLLEILVSILAFASTFQTLRFTSEVRY